MKYYGIRCEYYDGFNPQKNDSWEEWFSSKEKRDEIMKPRLDRDTDNVPECYTAMEAIEITCREGEEIKSLLTNYDMLNIGSWQGYATHAKDRTPRSALEFITELYNGELPMHMREIIIHLSVSMGQF